jgi:hypothetical protein
VDNPELLKLILIFSYRCDPVHDDTIAHSQASGVTANQECIDIFKKLKFPPRNEEPLKYIIYTVLPNEGYIKVEKVRALAIAGVSH